MNALQESTEGLIEAVVCSASHITSSPTGKYAHFSWFLHCLASKSRTGSPTRGILYLQIHLLRPGQATSVKNSPTMSTGPMNLNHLCNIYDPDPVFLQWWIFSKLQPHENDTLFIKRLKVFPRMHIQLMLVHQHRTFGIKLAAKNRKKEFPQSIFVQNTDNRVKKSISSWSSRILKPDLIPQSELQTDESFPVTLRLIRQDLSGPRFCIVSCFAWGAFNPSFTSHSSTFRS